MRNAASTGAAAETAMPRLRAYSTPAVPSTTHATIIQATNGVARTAPRGLAIGLILTFAVSTALRSTAAPQEEPPANLVKLAAHRESETEAERNEYMYR